MRIVIEVVNPFGDDVAPTVEQILQSEQSSEWLKGALMELLDMEPKAAVTDVTLLLVAVLKRVREQVREQEEAERRLAEAAEALRSSGGAFDA